MFVIIIGANIPPLYVRKPRHREIKISCPKLHSYEIKNQDPTQLAGLQSLHFWLVFCCVLADAGLRPREPWDQ